MKKIIMIPVCIVALVACSTDPNITGSLKLYHELDGQRFDMTGLESALDCSPSTGLPPADLPISGNENEDDIQISAPIGSEENPPESVEEPSEASPEQSEGEMAPSLDGSDSEAPMAGTDETEPDIAISGAAPSALARIAVRQNSSSDLTISFSYPNFVIRSGGDVALTGTWEPLDDNTVLITVDGDEQKVDIEIREDGVIIPILPEGLSLNPTCNPEPVTTPPDDGGEDPADDGDDNNGGGSDPGALPPSDENDPGNPAGNSVTESVDGFTFGTVKESFFFGIEVRDDDDIEIFVGITDEEVCCDCDTPGAATNLVTIGGIPPEAGSYESETMVVRVGRIDANGDPIGTIFDSESMRVTLLSLTEERATGTFSATFAGGQTVEGSFDAEVCPIEDD